jgi:hypothetical protein
MIRNNPISNTATTQQYAVELTENLCQPFCLTDSVQPQGNVTFSVGQIKVVDGIAYVEILANGTVTYMPKCGGCNSKVKQFSESFWVGFVGTTVPSVALTPTGLLQLADNVTCCNKAYGWTMVQSLTIAATFPS